VLKELLSSSWAGSARRARLGLLRTRGDAPNCPPAEIAAEMVRVLDRQRANEPPG
jgi:hypothetical protein